jgi:hypothetical protein
VPYLDGAAVYQSGDSGQIDAATWDKFDHATVMVGRREDRTDNYGGVFTLRNDTGSVCCMSLLWDNHATDIEFQTSVDDGGFDRKETLITVPKNQYWVYTAAYGNGYRRFWTGDVLRHSSAQGGVFWNYPANFAVGAQNAFGLLDFAYVWTYALEPEMVLKLQADPYAPFQGRSVIYDVTGTRTRRIQPT